jgi:hypothetical protein
MSVELKIEFNEAQLQQLLKIPVLLRLGPAERTLKAMAKPILVHGKAHAPDSHKPNKNNGTPSHDKQSKKAKKDWPEQGKNNLGVVFRKTDSGGYLVIGAKKPKGNTLNFDSAKGPRRHVLWGKTTLIRQRYTPPSERFMQKALDETKSAQESAGFAQLEKELRELKIG